MPVFSSAGRRCAMTAREDHGRCRPCRLLWDPNSKLTPPVGAGRALVTVSCDRRLRLSVSPGARHSGAVQTSAVRPWLTGPTCTACAPAVALPRHPRPARPAPGHDHPTSSARATGTPERGVRYRLGRCTRTAWSTVPGRGWERGSLPRHWWLLAGKPGPWLAGSRQRRRDLKVTYTSVTSTPAPRVRAESSRLAARVARTRSGRGIS
jgi:hypothetical protein